MGFYDERSSKGVQMIERSQCERVGGSNGDLADNEANVEDGFGARSGRERERLPKMNDCTTPPRY